MSANANRVRVETLEGRTLRTLIQNQPFDVVSVTSDRVFVRPHRGSGAERPILRERIEAIAGLRLSRERLRQRIQEEYPDTRNSSYMAAIVWEIMTAR